MCFSSPSRCPSAITDDRQSTTVPNTSNTSALTDASCGLPGLWPRIVPPIIANTPAARNSRRNSVIPSALLRRLPPLLLKPLQEVELRFQQMIPALDGVAELEVRLRRLIVRRPLG